MAPTSRPAQGRAGVRRGAAVLAVALLATACSRDSASSAPSTTAPASGTTAHGSEPDRPGGDELPTGLGDPIHPDLGAPGIDVTHYDVELTVDDELAASGTVTLTIEATEDLVQVPVDARSLTVEEVTLDGDPVDFTLTEPELIVRPDDPLPAGTTFDLAVTYVDDPVIAPNAERLGPGWIRADGYSFTLNEPEATRDWLPSLDHPSDKATWRIAVTPPEGLVAVANGVLVDQPDGGEVGAWVWETDDPMATYLVQVLVGDWTLVEGESASGVALSSALLTSRLDTDADFVALIDDQLAFFEDAFGPYPFPSYGVAVIDQSLGLALEQQGRSLFGPDAATESIAAHELAHQWFGNAVTPARWGDIWLSESFATYGQWLWDEHRGGPSIDAQAEAARERRAGNGGPATDDPTQAELFGPNVYEGGAVVVHALRREIGDEAFSTLLRRWVTDNAGTSRRTEDFTALADEVAGRDLSDFFDAWLSATELPTDLPG